MCFRPADAGAVETPKCPECGKEIQTFGGIVVKTCPFCKCDFTPYLDGSKEVPGAPAAPSAPAAPAPAPAAPAPAAPSPVSAEQKKNPLFPF